MIEKPEVDQHTKAEGKGMLLIRNCHLIDPASGTDGMRDILVEGEQIRSVARPG